MDQPDDAPYRDWPWEPVGFAQLDRGQLNAYATRRLEGAYNLIVHLIDGEPIRHTAADGGPPPGGPYPGYQQAADAARAAIGADGNYLLALVAYQAGALDPPSAPDPGAADPQWMLLAQQDEHRAWARAGGPLWWWCLTGPAATAPTPARDGHLAEQAALRALVAATGVPWPYGACPACQALYTFAPLADGFNHCVNCGRNSQRGELLPEAPGDGGPSSRPR